MGEIVGGYVIDPAVNLNEKRMTNEQLSRFITAFEGIVGAKYLPLIYIGSQRVTGYLYAYIAQRTFIYSHSVEVTLVKVVIHESFDNQLTIHSISEI
ncbi:hypothetical protein SAMN05192562_104499 [Kosakonia arachidis]|uniref:Uncharacterized protein n=1 Tax=Kosakonia arachidis TaxID=551989 RepID=A0A1I7D7F2_9ENTR|nr:hypothetical protein [Kosakonia arachidis]SFU07616.1 hypothetical protein SAMN05192562_104499 [Kosakonia arachidis]